MTTSELLYRRSGSRDRLGPRALSSAMAAHLTLAACLVLAALPLLLVDTIPLFDYANHLARVHVLANLDTVEAFQAHFERGGLLIPNVLADLVMLAFAPFGGVESAGRLFLLLVMVLTLTGAYAVGYAAAGRFSVWPLVISAFLYHEMLFWGFLNYVLGLGLLLWGIAAWLLLDGRSRVAQLATATVLGLMIFLCHLVAFGLFGVAVAVLELRRAWLTRSRGAVRVSAHLVVSALPFVPSLLLFVMRSPSRDLPMSLRFDYSLWGKFSPFTRLLSSGNPALDVGTVLAAAGLVAVALVLRKIVLHRGLALVAAAYFALVMVLPYSAMESYFLDSRIAIAVFFLLAVSLVPAGRAPRFAAAAALVLVALVGLRSAAITQDWRSKGESYAAVLDAFERVPRGSLVVSASTAWFEVGQWFRTRVVDPAHEHTVGYAAVRRDAIVPNLFAKAGQNPLVFVPAYPEMAPLRRNPITRVSDDWSLARFIEEVRAAAERVGDIEPELPGAFAVVFHKTCSELPDLTRVRRVACGDDFSLLQVLPTLSSIARNTATPTTRGLP